MPFLVLDPGCTWHKEILDGLERVFQALRDGGICYELTVQGELGAIWRILYQNRDRIPMAEAGKGRRQLQIYVQKMLAFIHENYAAPISLADIAAAARDQQKPSGPVFSQLPAHLPGQISAYNPDGHGKACAGRGNGYRGGDKHAVRISVSRLFLPELSHPDGHDASCVPFAGAAGKVGRLTRRHRAGRLVRAAAKPLPAVPFLKNRWNRFNAARTPATEEMKWKNPEKPRFFGVLSVFEPV